MAFFPDQVVHHCGMTIIAGKAMSLCDSEGQEERGLINWRGCLAVLPSILLQLIAGGWRALATGEFSGKNLLLRFNQTNTPQGAGVVFTAGLEHNNSSGSDLLCLKSFCQMH